MLIRRIRAKCQHEVTCIGTSATMVSGGTLDDQRSQVADVASKLFGKTFESSQVIMEKLASSLTAESNSPAKAELSAAIRQGVTKSDDLSALTGHPVVRWLETNAALDTQNDVLIRRKPQPVGTLAKTLAEHSGEDAGDCLRAVEATLLWISQVNESIQKSGRRDTILPFRLHQFVSQTGSVYTTLDQGSDRFITLEPGIYKSDDSNQKPIFPNVFSRTSGHPFICVTHMGNRLLPREFMEKSIEEEQGADGYILVGDVWNPEKTWTLCRTRGFASISPDASRSPKSWKCFHKKFSLMSLAIVRTVAL